LVERSYTYNYSGFYEIIAALSVRDRTRRANVLPLTLGPHGSNFEDVVAALKSLIPLDRGYQVEIKGKMVNLCVFTLCYLGDMPQQAANSGFKTSRAYKGCRFCMIDEDIRGQLDYDLVENGRFHHQTQAMREEMNSRNTMARRIEYGTEWGLNPTLCDPPLTQISPALDLILTRPADPAHSEYGGLASLSHEMFVQAVLTTAAGKEYNNFLRSFPFPPGWARLQSPLHHLRSYSLSEHARWAIIIPVLLRKFLKEGHMKKHFVEAVKAMGETPVEFVVSCYAALAKSSSILMGYHISIADRQNMDNIVREGRRRFQELCKAASKSINLNPKRLATPAPSRQGTPRAAESRRDKRAARQAGLSVEDTIIVEVPKVRDIINSVTLTKDRLKEQTLLKK
jgi:hypothetical protein